MPSYGGRTGAKIVVSEGREKEIMGGLKNALERGESIENAKKSFLNAGYKQGEIDSAEQKINGVVTRAGPEKPIVKQSPKRPPVVKRPVIQERQPIARSTLVKKPLANKKASKLWVMIFIVGSLLIFVGAAILGLYWDKLFG